MQFQAGDIFHVYNRGNNKQTIFFSDSNYQFFLQKVRDFIVPTCDILAYCLMPNHFHFLIQVNDTSGKLKQIGPVSSTLLKNGFRMLQSSYANAINKERLSTGSLFQQKTKFKLIKSDICSRYDYLTCCFHYIHQNPLKAGLVVKMEDWKYSSFSEYLGGQSAICDLDIARQVLDFPGKDFYEAGYSVVREELIAKLF